MSRHMRALCRILCGVLVLYSVLVTPDSARVMADGPGPDCLFPTVFAESDFYPPSNRAAAEALLPVPPLNPIGDVARVTPLPLTNVRIERAFEGVEIQAGQTAPVIGITYEFGTVPSTWPYFVSNDAPAFVTVSEMVLQQAQNSGSTADTSICGIVTASVALLARQLYVSVSSNANGEQATVDAIRQAILVDADISPVPPTYTPAPTVTVTPTPSATATVPAPTSTRPSPTPTAIASHVVRYYMMLRSQLLRAGPNGASATGALVRFKERVWPHGKPRNGWQYVTASGRRHGWVLASNILAVSEATAA